MKLDRMGSMTVYRASRVYTMDEGRPIGDAVAVADGRIVSVGAFDAMKPWLRRYPHEIDDRYRGKVILPGFIDPHTHLRMSATFMDLNYVGPIDSVAASGVRPALDSIDDVLAELRRLTRAAARTGPVLAWGFDPAVQGGHLDRDMLDAISDTVPIWVLAYAPHIAYVNSAMLELIGVDDDAVGHGLGRYADGRLNGWFMESEAVIRTTAPISDVLFDPGKVREGLARMATVAARAGVTTVAEMAWGMFGLEEEWNDHRVLTDEGRMPIRNVLVPFEPALQKQYGASLFEYLADKRAVSDDRLEVHGVKFVNDGSYPSMTLLLNWPGYLDGESGETGEIPWADLVDRMRPFWEHGIQIHSHANGDRTIEMTLDVLAALQRETPRFDHRFTIEHYSISSPTQAHRLAALGGTASVNPYFVPLRAAMNRDVGFGPDHAESTARSGSLARANVRFALHSDYNLVVAPLQPMMAVWAAVTRIGGDGSIIAPGERIDLTRALRAITIDAAYVLRRDDRIGSLEVGKLADMTVLDDDPYAVEAEDLRDVRVFQTVLGGIPQEV